MNVKIAIHSEFSDADVFITRSMPALPRVGDTFWLSEEDCEELETKAKVAQEAKPFVFRDWMYGNKRDELSFEDVLFVSEVRWEHVEGGYSPTILVGESSGVMNSTDRDEIKRWLGQVLLTGKMSG